MNNHTIFITDILEQLQESGNGFLAGIAEKNKDLEGSVDSKKQ